MTVGSFARGVYVYPWPSSRKTVAFRNACSRILPVVLLAVAALPAFCQQYVHRQITLCVGGHTSVTIPPPQAFISFDHSGEGAATAGEGGTNDVQISGNHAGTSTISFKYNYNDGGPDVIVVIVVTVKKCPETPKQTPPPASPPVTPPVKPATPQAAAGPCPTQADCDKLHAEYEAAKASGDAGKAWDAYDAWFKCDRALKACPPKAATAEPPKKAEEPKKREEPKKTASTSTTGGTTTGTTTSTTATGATATTGTTTTGTGVTATTSGTGTTATTGAATTSTTTTAAAMGGNLQVQNNASAAGAAGTAAVGGNIQQQNASAAGPAGTAAIGGNVQQQETSAAAATGTTTTTGTVTGSNVPVTATDSGNPATPAASTINALDNFHSQTSTFSPRIGFSWEPSGGKTVIRGGYGAFYGRELGQFLTPNPSGEWANPLYLGNPAASTSPTGFDWGGAASVGITPYFAFSIGDTWANAITWSVNSSASYTTLNDTLQPNFGELFIYSPRGPDYEGIDEALDYLDYCDWAYYNDYEGYLYYYCDEDEKGELRFLERQVALGWQPNSEDAAFMDYLSYEFGPSLYLGGYLEAGFSAQSFSGTTLETSPGLTGKGLGGDAITRQYIFNPGYGYLGGPIVKDRLWGNYGYPDNPITTPVIGSGVANTWQAQDNWNYIIGKHGLKAGVDWTYQTSPDTFLPSIDTWQTPSGSGSFTPMQFGPYGPFNYYQDDWKIGQSLTLKMGLTWASSGDSFEALSGEPYRTAVSRALAQAGVGKGAALADDGTVMIVGGAPGAGGVDPFSGFEKTFLSGDASVGLRVPFVQTERRESPPSFGIGGTEFTPSGFPDFENIFRSTTGGRWSTGVVQPFTPFTPLDLRPENVNAWNFGFGWGSTSVPTSSANLIGGGSKVIGTVIPSTTFALGAGATFKVPEGWKVVTLQEFVNQLAGAATPTQTPGAGGGTGRQEEILDPDDLVLRVDAQGRVILARGPWELATLNAAPPFSLESGTASWMALPLPDQLPQVNYRLVANGNSSGEAFELQVEDQSGQFKKVVLPDGVVLEPAAKKDPKAKAAGQMGGQAGNVLKQQITAFCLQFAKLPPEAGMLYKIADPDKQKQHRPAAYVMQAGYELGANGELNPDSDPKAYIDAIRQYAVWVEEEGWDEQQFTEHWIERTKKNAQALNIAWSKQMDDALRAAAPNRWRDITKVRERAKAMMQKEASPAF